jgi:hypothetical protein
MQNIVAAMAKHMKPAKRTWDEVLPMRTAEVGGRRRMGGQTPVKCRSNFRTPRLCQLRQCQSAGEPSVCQPPAPWTPAGPGGTGAAELITPAPLARPPPPARPWQDLEAWEKLDDVIMGGSSGSALAAAGDGTGAVWRGDLIVEVRGAGGGGGGGRPGRMASFSEGGGWPTGGSSLEDLGGHG